MSSAPRMCPSQHCCRLNPPLRATFLRSTTFNLAAAASHLHGLVSEREPLQFTHLHLKERDSSQTCPSFSSLQFSPSHSARPEPKLAGAMVLLQIFFKVPKLSRHHGPSWSTFSPSLAQVGWRHSPPPNIFQGLKTFSLSSG